MTALPRGSLRAAVVLVLALLSTLSFAQQPDERDIGVRIQRDGARIIVDVQLPVAATALETWAVATDYDHMASFISNLESSRIIQRAGNTLTIEQKGRASRGPLSFAFQNVREIVLAPPREIRSRLVSGDLEASEFITRVIDHGASAEIVNHGEFVPKVWVPPIIGPALIEAETRKQFAELRAEVLRRKTESPAGAH
jgi:hypothetical protein